MSKLIIVCGYPGTGKTTLASALSRELALPCLHKDFLKEYLYDSFEMSTLEDSKWVGKVTIGLLYQLAEQQIRRGVDLIIESPFNYTDDYKMLYEWTEKYDLEIISVVCTLEETERQKRIADRPRHRSHHDGDRELGTANNAIFESMPGKKIVIECNKPVEEMVNEIKSSL